MSGDGTRRPAQPSRTRVWAVALGCAVLVLGVVAWLALRGDEDPEATGDDQNPSSTSSASPSGTASGSGSADPSSPVTDATTPSAPTAPAHPKKPIRKPLGKSADLHNGVTVTITRIESVKGVGRGIGEKSGPALRFTVSVNNDTAKTLSLDLGLLNVYFGAEAAPASPLSGPGARALPSSLKAGQTGTGKYVFGVPTSQRGKIRVDFTYTTAAPKAIFTGPANG